MRRARITFIGAYHHIVSKGYNGENIFPDDKAKGFFLTLLKNYSMQYGIKVCAYTLLDNHYHLILINSSGNLSQFMRLLNGSYGSYYRRRFGGKGYVFQGRYWSSIISGTRYFKVAISYVLFNPVRAGIVTDPFYYRWNSVFYGTKGKIVISDAVFTDIIGEFFDSEEEFKDFVYEYGQIKLPTFKLRSGFFTGDLVDVERLVELFDRRQAKSKGLKMRIKEISIEDAINECKKKKGIKNMDEMEFILRKEKKVRGELLVFLRDRGFPYRKIIQLPYFSKMKFSALPSVYRFWKRKMERE